MQPANAKGDPLTFDLTGGEAHEVKGMELHDINPDKLLGDKGYDSDDIRNDLADRGIEPVIPPRSNRKPPIEYDREAYKRRKLIERCVNRLKQFRRIATRYEKTARAYLSMLCIAAARLWIKTVNTALVHVVLETHDIAIRQRPYRSPCRSLSIVAASFSVSRSTILLLAQRKTSENCVATGAGFLGAAPARAFATDARVQQPRLLP